MRANRTDHHGGITMTAALTERGIILEPRRDAWPAYREAHGLTSDEALSAAMDVAEGAVHDVLSGADAPSMDFVARALHSLPGATFSGLFEFVLRDA